MYYKHLNKVSLTTELRSMNYAMQKYCLQDVIKIYSFLYI